ncbi:MAG TPA: SRPBCC family protein [Pirellulaceae bacterium]|nr:SRPBCC family protein [Pirellulaceae bacterium]HMO92776.1 SRPBCC family protein [Pirellulaceae bacterium]HMP69358.1 SRPBCC family protein [Pirellulaceae bacterium]
MVCIETSRLISAPIEIVFDLCSNFADAATTIAEIQRIDMLTTGPVGVGTKFRETRRMLGRDTDAEIEVTDFQPPTTYTLSTQKLGARIDTTFSFVDEGGSTRLSIVWRASSPGSSAMKFVHRLMINAVRRFVESDLDSIQRAVAKQTSAIQDGKVGTK